MSVQMSTFQPIPEAKSPLTKWFHDTFLIDIDEVSIIEKNWVLTFETDWSVALTFDIAFLVQNM
jgi:hypothetical protein